MKRVEFRLLQLVRSHVSGDKLTLALVHWDGETLRVARSLAPLAVVEPAYRDGVRATAKEWIRRARELAAQLEAGRQLHLEGLGELFPVRQGLGAALLWTPLTSVQTADPEAHFASLRHELHLDHLDQRRRRRIKPGMLHDDLVALGEQLRTTLGKDERLRVGQKVQEQLPFTSPLSWKNGRWHHAVPFSLDGLDSEQRDREAERLYGLVQLAIPTKDVPVVVAVPARDSSSKDVQRVTKVLRRLLSERDGDWIVPARKRWTIDLDVLAERVRRDVEQDS